MSRFYYQPIVQALALAVLLSGTVAIAAIPFAIVALTTVMDEFFPEAIGTATPDRLSDVPLFLSALFAFASVLAICGLAAQTATALFTSPAATDALPVWALAGGIVGVGFLVGAAINVGHEFAHRVGARWALVMSHFIFALGLHCFWPIEHVFGHHRNVGTPDDPTTARRGEGFWHYFPRSVAGTYRDGFLIERDRLRRRGVPLLSVHSRITIAIAAQASIVTLIAVLFGFAGVVAFLLVALTAMIVIELFQYIGHYGLVRVAGTPVRAAHAWEWSHLGTSSLTLNLVRHSDHHLAAGKPFWAIDRTNAAPVYPLSPNPTLFAALVPPVFRALAAPALTAWDATLATPAERHLVADAGGPDGPDRAEPDGCPDAARPGR